MASKTAKKRPASQEMIDSCFAKAVAEGDIVNFKFLFIPYSPVRANSVEDVHVPRYAYLRPTDTSGVAYKNALDLVARPEMRAHLKAQLDKAGPPQYPAELLLMLADNAVRLGKYSAAAQAYELLRIRRRMRDEFLDAAEDALDAGDIKTAVRGYVIASGLDYDYSAFPEPLPQVPDFQATALQLHADYPQRPEDSVALQQPAQQLRTGLDYLLINPELSARLEARSFDTQLAFFVELVHQRDANWADFAKRYVDTCAFVTDFGKRMEAERSERPAGSPLAAELDKLKGADEPRQIPARLLGREIPEGTWWQYLKELAYQHPAAVLFVSRQVVSADLEIILPRFMGGSPLPAALGILPPA